MDKLIEALDKILRTCIEFFGVNFTIFLIFAIPLGLLAYKIYTDWVKRHEVNATVKALEGTIQVLAEHNRELRVIELKHLGWSDKAIEKFIMKSTPKDAIEAREMLQKANPIAKIGHLTKVGGINDSHGFYISNCFVIFYL